jgi:hypothetical protein
MYNGYINYATNLLDSYAFALAYLPSSRVLVGTRADSSWTILDDVTRAATNYTAVEMPNVNMTRGSGDTGMRFGAIDNVPSRSDAVYGLLREQKEALASLHAMSWVLPYGS